MNKKIVRKRLAILLSILTLAVCGKVWQELLTKPLELHGFDNFPAYTLKAPPPAQGPFAVPKRADYKEANGQEHRYLYLPAENPSSPRTVIIYVHGAGGNEFEGIDPQIYEGVSGRIRAACRDRFWHYVSPRDYEFDSLLGDVKQRLAAERIFVVGMSQGGRMAFFHQRAHPDAFDGVIYGCPAVSLYEAQLRKLEKPKGTVAILAGELEPDIGPFCRYFAGTLSLHHVPFVFIEYPKGGHCDPIRLANWDALFNFLIGPLGR